MRCLALKVLRPAFDELWIFMHQLHRHFRVPLLHQPSGAVITKLWLLDFCNQRAWKLLRREARSRDNAIVLVRDVEQFGRPLSARRNVAEDVDSWGSRSL